MLLEILSTGMVMSFQYVLPEDAKKHQYRYISVVKDDPHCIHSMYETKLCSNFIDPPMYGYKYGEADTAPYYWDNENFITGRIGYKVNHYRVSTNNAIVFTDIPQDPRLKGSERVTFTTCIVDTHQNNKPLECIDWHLNAKNQKLIDNQYIPTTNPFIGAYFGI